MSLLASVVRPPLVSPKIHREIGAHADPVLHEIAFVSLASTPIAGGEAAEPVHDALPWEIPPAGVGDPADLPGRPGGSGEKRELPVGHDLSPRHPAQDLVHEGLEGEAWHVPAWHIPAWRVPA